MKNTPLYICDSDSVYLDKLSRYIMGKQHSPFLVKGLTEYDEAVLGNLNEGIILISSDLIREKAITLNVHHTILLVNSEIDKSLENFESIYKYQAAGIIYQKLLQYQMNRSDIGVPQSIVNENKIAKMMGMFSPIHRIGKSKLLKEMCVKAGETEKVLLISLEEYSKSKEEGDGLSELIYYYEQGKLKYEYCLEYLVHRMGNYDYILPVKWGRDLRDISSDDWEDLISIIRNWGIYDSIWIDFDSITGFESLLSACEKIYMPYIEDTEEYLRIHRFEEMMDRMTDLEIRDRIIKINMENRGVIR